MKKYKKLLAIILACTLVLGLSLQALASSKYETTGTFKGDGEVIYDDLDAEVFICDLPTGLAFDFILDPQGLYTLQDGATFKPDQLEDGYVIFKEDTTPTVISKSSVEVELEVEIKATDSGNKIEFVPKEDRLAKEGGLSESTYGYKPDLFIQFIASTASVDDADTPFAGTIGRAVSTDPVKFNFVLEATEYSYVKTVQTDGTFDLTFMSDDDAAVGTQLKPYGAIGTKGDWSAYTGATPATVSLEVIFTIDEYTGDRAAKVTAGEIDDDVAYGLILDTVKDIENDADLFGTPVAITIASAGSGTVNINTGTTKAEKGWTAITPLTVKFTFDPVPGGIGRVASSLANVEAQTSLWTEGTDYTYDANTGILTIIRFPAGNTVAFRTNSINYVITFTG